jgi:hypothetical protein
MVIGKKTGAAWIFNPPGLTRPHKYLDFLARFLYTGAMELSIKFVLRRASAQPPDRAGR